MAARACLQAAAALVLASCLPAAMAGSAPGTLATPPPSVVWVKLSGRNCLDTCEAGGLAAVARGRLCAVPNSWPAPEGSDTTWLYEGTRAGKACGSFHDQNATSRYYCGCEPLVRTSPSGPTLKGNRWVPAAQSCPDGWTKAPRICRVDTPGRDALGYVEVRCLGAICAGLCHYWSADTGPTTEVDFSQLCIPAGFQTLCYTPSAVGVKGDVSLPGQQVLWVRAQPGGECGWSCLKFGLAAVDSEAGGLERLCTNADATKGEAYPGTWRGGACESYVQPPEPEPYCGCVPSEDSYLWSSLDDPLACSLREEEDAAYDPLPFGDSLSMICRVEQQGQVSMGYTRPKQPGSGCLVRSDDQAYQSTAFDHLCVKRSFSYIC